MIKIEITVKTGESHRTRTIEVDKQLWESLSMDERYERIDEHIYALMRYVCIPSWNILS